MKFKLKVNGSKEKKVRNNDIILKGRLARYLGLGLNLDESCKLSNINKDKLAILRMDSEFESFIQQCLSKGKSDFLQSIKTAADTGQWQAAAWYLERRFPDEFGRKDMVRHEYSLKLQTFQNVIISVLNDESPDIKARILQKLRNYEFKGDGVANSQEFKPSTYIEYENGD